MSNSLSWHKDCIYSPISISKQLKKARGGGGEGRREMREKERSRETGDGRKREREHTHWFLILCARSINPERALITSTRNSSRQLWRRNLVHIARDRNSRQLTHNPVKTVSNRKDASVSTLHSFRSDHRMNIYVLLIHNRYWLKKHFLPIAERLCKAS